MHVDCLFDYGVFIYRPDGGYPVAYVSNNVRGLVEYVNTFGWDFVELRANMLGVQQDIQSTKGDMESGRTDCHNLKGHTHGIWGATETIKSLNLALSLEHQTILGELKTVREDVQRCRRCKDPEG